MKTDPPLSTSDSRGLLSSVSQPPSYRGADLLVDSLIAAGIKTIFGVPGDTGVVFYDALYSHTSEINHVLARDERHAASMADGFARVSGDVGVVEVSSGGGTTYVVGGLGEAYASGVPILLITSDIHSSSRGTGALTEIDQVALFSAVTKSATVIQAAQEIPSALISALEIATTGRPGPVALIIPEEVLDELAVATPTGGLIRPASARSGASTATIMAAKILLENAERLVIVAGSGVHTSGASAALSDLAMLLGAGIATTIHGRGCVVDDNPWSLGVCGNNGGQPGVNGLLQEADVVLFVGTRANATDTNSFTAPDRNSAKTIHIDIDSTRASMNYPHGLALVGDARVVLEQLIEAVAAVSPALIESRQQIVAAARKDRVDPYNTPGRSGAEPSKGLLPIDVITLVASIVPPATLTVADPGTPTPNVANYWPVKKVGRNVIIPRGHGPMGYAIPAAIGMAVARRNSSVVSFTADGSFAMACGELETVARLNLPILFIQFTNHSFGWIKMLQHLYSEERYFGVDPGDIDSVMVARACGLKADRPKTLDQLRKLVHEFATSAQPVYIDIEVPHMIDHTPPVPAWYGALLGDKTRPAY